MDFDCFYNKLVAVYDKNTTNLKAIGVLVDYKKENNTTTITLYLVNSKEFLDIVLDVGTIVTMDLSITTLSKLKNFSGLITVNNEYVMDKIFDNFKCNYQKASYIDYPTTVYIDKCVIKYIGSKDNFPKHLYNPSYFEFQSCTSEIYPSNYISYVDYALDYRINTNNNSWVTVPLCNTFNRRRTNLKKIHEQFKDEFKEAIDLKDIWKKATDLTNAWKHSTLESNSSYVPYSVLDVEITASAYAYNKVQECKKLEGKNVLIFNVDQTIFIGVGRLDKVWKDYQGKWVCRVEYNNSEDKNRSYIEGVDWEIYNLFDIIICENDWNLNNFKQYIPSCLIHINSDFDYRVIYELYNSNRTPPTISSSGYVYIHNNRWTDAITEIPTRCFVAEHLIFEMHNGNIQYQVYKYNLETNKFIEPTICGADFAQNNDVTVDNTIIKEENNMEIKFTTEKGKRYVSNGKHNGKEIETITTYVDFLKFDRHGKPSMKCGTATIDADQYDERQGILEALANAIYGNFDNAYDKYIAEQKRKEKELCRCKTCGRWYFENDDADDSADDSADTNKIKLFTPEDARAHEAWHIQNRKDKKERRLIRKEAEKRVAEIKREQEIETLVNQMLDNDNV